MSRTSLALLALFTTLALYQAYVSVRLIRSTDYEPNQKLAQLLLVWLIPLLGATAVHWFLSHGTSHSPPDKPDRNHIPQAPNHRGR